MCFGGGLENRCTSYWRTESSNLSPSANPGSSQRWRVISRPCASLRRRAGAPLKTAGNRSGGAKTVARLSRTTGVKPGDIVRVHDGPALPGGGHRPGQGQGARGADHRPKRRPHRHVAGGRRALAQDAVAATFGRSCWTITRRGRRVTMAHRATDDLRPASPAARARSARATSRRAGSLRGARARWRFPAR